MALLVLLGGAVLSTDAAVTTEHLKTDRTVSASTNLATGRNEAGQAAVNHSVQSVQQGATSPINSKSSDTLAPSSSSGPAKTSTVQSPPPANPPVNTASPPSSPPPAIHLTLDTLTFDYTNNPTITFTLPVTSSGSGSVAVTMTKTDTGTTLCSQTLTFSATGTQSAICGYTTNEPPHLVYATATAGTTSVQSNSVYVGSLSW